MGDISSAGYRYDTIHGNILYSSYFDITKYNIVIWRDIENYAYSQKVSGKLLENGELGISSVEVTKSNMLNSGAPLKSKLYPPNL